MEVHQAPGHKARGLLVLAYIRARGLSPGSEVGENRENRRFYWLLNITLRKLYFRNRIA